MKAIWPIFLSVAMAMPMAAQDSTNSSLRQTCTNIAAKLYPDVTKQNSDLLGLIAKMEKVLRVRDSGVFELDQEPLVVAAAAADILKIQPNWSALTDTEKETAYYSLADAMMFTHDFTAKDASAINQESSSPAWKQGDDLGTITTTGGTVYSSVKLQSVDPDGITILDSDGGAKISFDKLPNALQKRFEYDPQQADSFAQKQAYKNQIAQLSDENAKLRYALSQYKGALAQSQDAAATPQVQPSRKGYVYFYNYIVNSGQRSSRGVLLNEFQKMTDNEKMVAVQQKWEALSEDEKVAYEQKAQEYGPGPDPASPVPRDNQYNVNVTNDPNR